MAGIAGNCRSSLRRLFASKVPCWFSARITERDTPPALPYQTGQRQKVSAA
jgi:hypothetical protein